MSTRGAKLAVAIAWALALGTTSLLRYRGSWDPYVALHQRLADAGVPSFVRNLDYILIALVAASLAGVIASVLTTKHVSACLLMRRPARGWWKMALAASAPMVLGGVVLMLERGGALPGWHALYSGVLRAPLVEELLYRSVLVAIPLAALGGRPRVFWAFAFASALVFGLVHVEWTPGAIAGGWATILVTGAGGVWYAWLMRAWGSVLVPVVLHGAMNLGWALAGAGGAAGGGLVENILRVATITIATWWTLHTLKRAKKEPRRNS